MCTWILLVVVIAIAVQFARVAFVLSFMRPYDFEVATPQSIGIAKELRTVPPVHLSQEQIDQYLKQRFLVIPGAVPRSVARKLLVEAGNASTPWYWRRHFSGTLSVARFQNWRASPVIREFIVRSPLLPAVYQLMESKHEVRLLADHIAGIVPGSKGFAWHTDLGSFGVTAENSSTRQLMSTWCPVWVGAYVPVALWSCQANAHNRTTTSNPTFPRKPEA